jgi:hypothetical protein
VLAGNNCAADRDAAGLRAAAAPARYKGATADAGFAKSHFFAELWLDENVSQKLDYVCIREVQKSLTFSVKKLLEQKIEAFNAGRVLRRAGQEDHVASAAG